MGEGGTGNGNGWRVNAWLAGVNQHAAFKTAHAIGWQGLVSPSNRPFAQALSAQAAINIKFSACSSVHTGP
jgi:hypothetical protein